MRAFRRGPSSLCRNFILIFGFAIAFQLTRIIIKQLEIPQAKQSVAKRSLKSEFKRVIPGPSTDASGKYKIHRFYKSEGFGTKMVNKDVTFVTHCTVDQLYHLMEMSDRWDGPMSVSIYAPGLDASFVDDAIDGLRLCWPVLREMMTFHLVYPANVPANMSATGSFAYLACKDVTRKLMQQKSELQTNDQIQGQVEYPHNLLRNIAKESALTEYVLVGDIGMIPSENLRETFVEFAKENKLFDRSSEISKLNEKIAYTLATYEIRTENGTPKNKKNLQEMVKQKNARVLMQETCWFCQKPLDYDKWIEGNPDEAFGIAYTQPFVKTWMPFYISKRSTTPTFDEDFTLYGYDRLIQICEMKKRGFSFQILNLGFLVNRGFRAKSGLSPDERQVLEQYEEFKDNFSSALAKIPKYSQDEAYKEC